MRTYNIECPGKTKKQAGAPPGGTISTRGAKAEAEAEVARIAAEHEAQRKVAKKAQDVKDQRKHRLTAGAEDAAGVRSGGTKIDGEFTKETAKVTGKSVTITAEDALVVTGTGRTNTAIDGPSPCEVIERSPR